MAKNLVNFFNPESRSGEGGGGFFADGPYRIEKARFVLYDFKGKATGKNGDGINCLCMELQPLDKDGGDAGDAVTQYWGVGEDSTPENKGKSFTMTGSHDTYWALSDFGQFMDALGKSGYDIDAVAEENDVSIMDGMVAEFGKVPQKRTGGAEKINPKTGKPYPPTPVIVVTNVPDAKPAKGGAKAGAKPAAGSKKKSDEPNAEELLANYLAEVVLVEKNEAKGVEKIQARMGIGKYVQANGGDADVVKTVTTAFGDDKVLGAILESAGWELAGSKIKKAA